LQKLKHAYESLHSFACENETLETDVDSYECKGKELDISLHNTTIERDCFKRQAADLEELFESVSSENKVSDSK
jgi:hypothetical protein